MPSAPTSLSIPTRRGTEGRSKRLAAENRPSKITLGGAWRAPRRRPFSVCLSARRLKGTLMAGQRHCRVSSICVLSGCK